MKKLFLTLSIVIGTIGSANAGITNQYIGIKLSDGFVNNISKFYMENALYPDTHTEEARFNDNIKNPFGGGIAYGIIVNNNLRLETEVSHNLKTQLSGHSRIGIGGHFIQDWWARLQISSTSFMLNAYYDINTGTKFTPFITFGAGAIYSHMSDIFIYSDLIPDGLIQNAFKNDYETNLALQLGAGLSYKITPKFALDLEYKYLYIGELVYEAAYNSYYEASLYKIENMVMHKVQIGARYMF